MLWVVLGCLVFGVVFASYFQSFVDGQLGVPLPWFWIWLALFVFLAWLAFRSANRK